MTKEKQTKVVTSANIMHGVGFASGIAYSIYNKTGFWKGFGYSILFGMMGAGLGAGASYILVKDDKKTTATPSDAAETPQQADTEPKNFTGRTQPLKRFTNNKLYKWR